VLVAGAGGGIGRAVALAFARTGANLVLTGRTRSSLEAVGAECADSPDVLVEPCDVSRPGDVERLMSSAVGAFGGIDVLVNAAGVHGAIGPVQECDPGEWMRGVEVNLFGSFLLARAVIPGMLERQVGRIVLFSGGGATSPLPMFSAYAASKAGIVRLAETLAEELRPSVQVNAIAPGIVDTTLLDAVLAAGARAGAEYEQVRRIRVGDTEPVPGELAAELVVFLATHASPSLTGRLISAPHDPWRGWGNGDSPEDGLYTLRRMDPHTLGPLMKALQ
jgi:3-oxoacyl-[acyl-carrier protein] reductase